MNDKLLAGMAVGAVGALILAPAVVPPLARLGRPAAKAALKTAVLAWYRGQEFLAEMQEVAEDAYAEAMAELMDEAESGAPDAADATTGAAAGVASAAKEIADAR